MAESLSEAAHRLSASFASEGDVASTQDHRRVREALQTFLLARFPRLGSAELLDIVDETIERLLGESRSQGQALEHASAWLFTVARREAIDRLRRDRSDPLEDADLIADDEVAALIDRQASRSVVEDAFRQAYLAGDHLAIRIAMGWLDAVAATGTAPSSRALAEAVGYSHTTVNDALARFRSYVAKALSR